MKRRALSVFLSLTLLLGAAVAAVAQTTISTEGMATNHSWGGYAGGLTIGQTFEAPNLTDVFLQTMRFSVHSTYGVAYTARLLEWDGLAPAGPVLFEESRPSSPTVSGSSDPAGTYQTFAVNQLLDPSRSYVFMASLAGDFGGSRPVNGNSNPYDGGNVVFAWTDDVSGANWVSYADYDLGFSAEFGPNPGSEVVPEPATLLLLGTGLLGLMGIAARRRREGVLDRSE